MLKILRSYRSWDFDEHEEWSTALKIATVRSLQGLRQVKLRIEWSMTSAIYSLMKQKTHLSYCNRDTEGLQELATLPLTSVEIAFKKSPFRNYGSMAKAWSKAERTEYAKVLRKMLSVPRELMMDFYDGPWRWHASLPLKDKYCSSWDLAMCHDLIMQSRFRSQTQFPAEKLSSTIFVTRICTLLLGI